MLSTGLRIAESPMFVRQTRTAARQEAPDVRGVDDLPDAPGGGLPTDTRPWRVHLHAPPHADPEPPLRTTADQPGRVLAGLLGGASADCDHMEVETCTWSVLPEPAHRPARRRRRRTRLCPRPVDRSGP